MHLNCRDISRKTFLTARVSAEDILTTGVSAESILIVGVSAENHFSWKVWDGTGKH